MALFYQSGRVSRFAVGTPGFSTNRDLTLSVSGAIGIETAKPRASIDTPEISIRGPIYDAGIQTGGLGYFLSQDIEGVKWVAASPQDLTFIRVFEDDVQVGVSSFSGLNFISNDSSLFDIKESAIGPNIADINFNTYWIRTEYGNNAGISTGYGPDGTYASLPGYGTSEAVGVTSVGIGTDNPQDDFQVGIGSTGVTINGPEGKLEAETIKAKNIEIEGNITVESLIVDPGIATFRGNIDAQGISSFTGDVIAGFATIQELYVNDLEVELFRAGVSTLGFGQSASSFTVVENGLEVQGNIGTFFNDLYVGNDLFVAGDTFFNQINAENIRVTGISTLNAVEGNTGIFTSFEVTGITTLNQLEFNTGVGTNLQLESSTIGVLTATDINAGVATIGFASIGDANVSGIVTVTEVDVEQIDIERAQVGILTITEGLSVTGTSTFVGLVTVTGDAFIDGDLTVTDQFTVQDLGAENLEVTGIGTIVNLESNVGIITTLFTEGSVNTGVGTFNVVEANDIQAGTGTIGGVGFESGRLEGDELDFDRARIGILTGDLLSYGIGTFRNQLNSPGTSNIAVAIGSNLNYSGFSQINGVTFGDELVDILNRDLQVSGITSFIGLGTFGDSLYVKEDLFVGGELSFEQLTGTNLQVLGIATINQLDLNTGIGTFLDLEFLQVGVATITNLLGTISTITRMDSGTVAVTTDPSKYPTSDGQFYADRAFTEFLNSVETFSTDLTVFDETDLQGTLEVTGLSTFSSDIDVNADINVSGLTTTNFLFAGVGTILLLDTDFINSDEINAGIITTQDLVVTGSADFQGDVVVDIGGTANIANANIGFASVTEEVVGTSTVGFLSATDANIGVATVGLLSATDAEIEDLEVNTFRAGIATVGFGSFGTDSSEGALYVTGINTFVGFTTFTGEVFINGDLTVSGITTFKQLDAEQSQIGILTTKTLLDSNGLIDAENVAISTNLTVSGLTTLTGFTTTADVIVGGGLTVVGDTTFLGIVSITDTLFVNQEITGIATVNNLNFNVGIGSTLTVGILSATDLYVAGVSTFVGVGTFENDLYVSQDLFVERNIVAAAISAENYFATGVSTFSDTNIEGSLGISSSVQIDENLIVDGNAVVGGGITFEGDIDIDSNVNVDIQGNINATGISTFNDLRFNTGIGTFLDLEQLDVGIATIATANITTSYTGFASITNETVGLSTVEEQRVGILTVGFGKTVGDGTFYRTGIGTIVGFTTYKGDIFIDGNQTITGVVSFSQLDANQSRIGILTVNDLLDSDFIFSSGPLGFATLNNFSANLGIVTGLTVSGVLTAQELEVEDLTVTRNLLVGGISTLGAPGPTGFTTTLGDLYVGGDLFVQDDIFYDEISGRNLFISGVGTINTLFVNTGIVTTLSADDFDANVGVVTNLTVGVATVGTYIGTSIQTETLDVTGVSTFNGNAVFNNDVRIDNNLDVVGIITAQNIEAVGFFTGPQALIGQILADNATINTIMNTNLMSGVTSVTNQLDALGDFQALGISTINTIESITITNSGIVSTQTLVVESFADIEDLKVNDTATIDGTVTINNDVFITTGDLVITEDLTARDILATRNLQVAGISTLPTLDSSIVDINGFLNVTGVSTVTGTARVTSLLTVDNTLTANTGIITSIIGDQLTYNSGVVTSFTVTGDQLINNNLFVNGITTSVNLTVNDTATITNINSSGVSTFASADINLADITNLTYNSGFGTSLTLEYGNITETNIGVGTIQYADIVNTNVAIGTVTTLDIEDITRHKAYRLQTSSTAQTAIFSTTDLAYQTYEITIQAVSTGNIHSTKILASHDGGTAYFNEYSTVFNNIELGVYDIVVGGGALSLLVTPDSAATTTFTATVVATKV
jgi:hypothetical protein